MSNGPSEAMASRLRVAAIAAATRAQQSFPTTASNGGSVDYAEFCLHAWRAFELAGKCRLAEISPILLAPGDNQWVKNAANLHAGNATHARTLRASDIPMRLDLFKVEADGVGPGKNLCEELEALQVGRNGFVHAGDAVRFEDQEATRIAGQWLKTLASLLGVAPADLQPPAEEPTGLSSDDQRRVILEALRERLRSAPAVVDELLNIEWEDLKERAENVAAGRSENQRSQALREAKRLTEYDYAVTPCPVCGVNAMVIVGEYDDHGEPEFERDGVVSWCPRPVILTGLARCLNCGLAVHDKRIMERAGIPTLVDVPEAAHVSWTQHLDFLNELRSAEDGDVYDRRWYASYIESRDQKERDPAGYWSRAVAEIAERANDRDAAT